MGTIKAFNRADFDSAINELSNIKTALGVNIGEEYAQKIDAIQKIVTESRDVIIYNETNIPDEYDVDYEIRNFFDTLCEAVRTKKVDSKVIQNMREVGDNPTWLFELIESYLLAYTKKTQEIGYLESKRKSIVGWLDEIKKFGYESREERLKELASKPQE